MYRHRRSALFGALGCFAIALWLGMQGVATERYAKSLRLVNGRMIAVTGQQTRGENAREIFSGIVEYDVDGRTYRTHHDPEREVLLKHPETEAMAKSPPETPQTIRLQQPIPVRIRYDIRQPQMVIPIRPDSSVNFFFASVMLFTAGCFCFGWVHKWAFEPKGATFQEQQISGDNRNRILAALVSAGTITVTGIALLGLRHPVMLGIVLCPAIALLGLAAYLRMGSNAVSQIRISASPQPAVLGLDLLVQVDAFVNSPPRLQLITVKASATRMVERRDKNLFEEVAVWEHRAPCHLEQQARPTQEVTGTCTIALPVSLPPSAADVRWELLVRIVLRGWPDRYQMLPIPVIADPDVREHVLSEMAARIEQIHE